MNWEDWQTTGCNHSTVLLQANWNKSTQLPVTQRLFYYQSSFFGSLIFFLHPLFWHSESWRLLEPLSCRRVTTGFHLGPVASLSQGHTAKQTSHSHSHSLRRPVSNVQVQLECPARTHADAGRTRGLHTIRPWVCDSNSNCSCSEGAGLPTAAHCHCQTDSQIMSIF